MMKTGVIWFRRDLRLTDNTALSFALKECETVIPVFVLEPALLEPGNSCAAQIAWMLEALRSLDANLRHLGSRLVLCHGGFVPEITGLLRRLEADAVYWNRDYEPAAIARDAAVEEFCGKNGIRAVSAHDQCLRPPGEVLKDDGMPYTVFTPFSKRWKMGVEIKHAGAPKVMPAVPEGVKGVPLPSLKDLGHAWDRSLPGAGERAGLDAMKSFIRNHLGHYADRRDIPSAAATSHMSVHLRFGTVSPRVLLAAVRKTVASGEAEAKQAEIYVNELIWRDFYQAILFHFPHVEKGCFRPEYDAVAWENDEELFAAWREGRTGYPIVDAAMRQLNQTGWMHNRLRMITASFLTKDLLVDWRWGERYFMSRLIDGELAANNGGWQWAAGTGTDAQPYFRIFNPSSQTQKFDPEEKFIRQYIPELETVAYPKPVVVHSRQREKALAMYKAAKSQD